MQKVESIESYNESDLEEGKPKVVLHDGYEVCLLRFQGQYYAFSNICTHIGGRLSQGTVSDLGKITCKLHNATYDIRDGRSVSFTRRGLFTYEVKVRDGKISLGERKEAIWKAGFPKPSDFGKSKTPY